jgi:outer membrane protein TolC
MLKTPPKLILLGLLVAEIATAETAGTLSALTLRQAIEQAVNNNLQTRLSQERTTESRARQGIGRSALLPQISGTAYQMNVTANLSALGLTSLPGYSGMPTFVGPYNRFDARFAMTQSLFNFGSFRRYQATRYGFELAEQQRRLAVQQVTAETALAYIAVLQASQSVTAAEANVELSQQLLNLAANQRNAGVATGLDVTRAETRLASQQVRLAQAKTNQDTANLNLLRVIGMPLSVPISPAESLKFEPQPSPDAGEAVQQALGTRLELPVAAAQLRIAEAERKAAIGDLMPSVSAFGDYGSSGLKPNEANLPTRSVGVRIDVPVFNGGRTRSEVQAATSRVHQAEMQLADVRAAVEKDVRQALDELATREEQMRAAQKNLDLAQRELSLARDRFQNGVGDNIDVTAAQTALEDARQLAVSSMAQFNIARLNLLSAMGRAESFSF